jgi:hypothetical protein
VPRNRFRQAGNRFLGFLKDLQIGAQFSRVRTLWQINCDIVIKTPKVTTFLSTPICKEKHIMTFFISSTKGQATSKGQAGQSSTTVLDRSMLVKMGTIGDYSVVRQRIYRFILSIIDC